MLIYSGLTAISFFLVLFWLPETRGLTLTELSTLFTDNKGKEKTDDRIHRRKSLAAQDLEWRAEKLDLKLMERGLEEEKLKNLRRRYSTQF